MTSTADHRANLQSKTEQRKREATERAAERAEMMRGIRERNAETSRASDDQLQTWRDACDAYDPQALRHDVVEAGRRVQQALVETPALQALVDLIAAMVIEQRAASEYRDNASRVGIEPADRKPAPTEKRDHTGRGWMLVDELPMQLLPQVIVQAGLERADEGGQ